MTAEHTLETSIRALMAACVWGSTACLVVGLALWLVQHDSSRAVVLLNSGIVILMATPVLRVMLAAAEAVRAKDWPHLATIATVSLLLALTLAYAAAST